MCDVKVSDIYFTEFGAALTTVLPVLFKYCYTYSNDVFWLYYFALARCPPGILHFIRELITILIILARPPGPFLTK
jgi:hypothetical protein